MAQVRKTAVSPSSVVFAIVPKHVAISMLVSKSLILSIIAKRSKLFGVQKYIKKAI